MILRMGRDTNGNRILKVSFRDDRRGFSVQTNGNLPETHNFPFGTFTDYIAEHELRAYITKYGTDKQKTLMKV